MRKKFWKKIGWILGIIVLIGNVIIYNHAYKFTHFAGENTKTKSPELLSFSEKLKIVFWGVSVPKPSNKVEPSIPYKTTTVGSSEKLELWEITAPNHEGIIIMFHGYASSKSSLLPYAREFNQKNYSTILVDFMGSGGSLGNVTTIGYQESRNVKAVFNYVKKAFPTDKIILFGTSMGAVAIMKAIKEYSLAPAKIVIECPFGNMLTTTENRFNVMGIPAFPFAHLLLFYGCLQTGVNLFKHSPIAYAKHINISTLLLYGSKDSRVNAEEINDIYENLSGEKRLVIFKNAGHEVYLNDHKEDWNNAIDSFFVE